MRKPSARTVDVLMAWAIGLATLVALAWWATL